MPVEFTEYDVWSFHREDNGGWKWSRRSPDGDLLLEAREALPDLDACQDDARRSGYQTANVAKE